MIRVQIKTIAQKKGIRNAYGLQQALGISPSAAAKLWNGNIEMIGFNTLNKLCQHFDCYVGDLLMFEPDQLEHEKAKEK